MNIWSLLLVFGAAFGLVYTALALAILIFSVRQKRSLANHLFTPPVTIFKPLKGVDENLRQNLESFFTQDYPRFELIFGVNDDDDPAVEIVRNLISVYPHVPARLVIDSRRTGYNPKVNNLCNMSPHASHDHWVISDSNVRVESSYLKELVGEMRNPKVGLVTSLIRGVGGKRLGAKLENLHLNSFIAASTLAVSKLSNIPVSIGKSMLMRRETIARMGGFERFADFLLEDGLIGREVRKMGLETATCMHAINNVNDTWSVRDFMARHFRWGLMRRHLNIVHYSGEIVSNPIVLSLIAIAVDPSAATLALAAGFTALKVLLDLVAVQMVGGSISLSSLWLLPLKDILIAAVWWRPFFTNHVTWRGNRMRIGKMTRISPVQPSMRFVVDRESSRIGRAVKRFRHTGRRLVLWGSGA
jgi:ceramide glucosyltransferase